MILATKRLDLGHEFHMKLSQRLAEDAEGPKSI